MSDRVVWQERFGIVHHQHANGASYEPTFGAGQTGVEYEKYAIQLLNLPNLFYNLPPQIVNKSSNFSYPGINDATLKSISHSFKLEFDATLPLLGLFFWLLFHNGTSEGGASTYTKTFVPYTSSLPTVWASLLGVHAESGISESHTAHGCICRSLTLSGTEGGVVRCSAEMVCRRSYHNANVGSSLLNFSGAVPILFQDLDFWIDYSAYPIYPVSFTYTITNNAAHKFSANDSIWPVTYTLGVLDHSASFITGWGDGGSDAVGMLAGVTDVKLRIANTSETFVIYNNAQSRIVSSMITDSSRIFSVDWSSIGFNTSITVADSVNRSVT